MQKLTSLEKGRNNRHNCGTLTSQSERRSEADFSGTASLIYIACRICDSNKIELFIELLKPKG